VRLLPDAGPAICCCCGGFAATAAADFPAAEDEMMDVGSNVDDSTGLKEATYKDWINVVNEQKSLTEPSAAETCSSRMVDDLGLINVASSSSKPVPPVNKNESKGKKGKKGKAPQKPKYEPKAARYEQYPPEAGHCKVVFAARVRKTFRSDIEVGWSEKIVYEGGPGTVRMVFDMHLAQPQRQNDPPVLRIIGTCKPSGSSATGRDSPEKQLLLQAHRVLAGILLWLFKLVRGLDVEPHTWGVLQDVTPTVKRAAAGDSTDSVLGIDNC
jgi:hypothetical protein